MGRDTAEHSSPCATPADLSPRGWKDSGLVLNSKGGLGVRALSASLLLHQRLEPPSGLGGPHSCPRFILPTALFHLQEEKAKVQRG